MPATAASPITRPRFGHSSRFAPWPRVAGCAGGTLALLLAACAHHPQAAVPAAGATGAGGPVVAVSTGQDRALCRDDPATRAELGRVAHALLAQGLALQATCQAPGGWVVQVLVVDGMKARQVVRGPLADGQVVDMGTPSGNFQAGASATAPGHSPDVVHNRQWLHALMARHQFDNLPDAWWHFAQRHGDAIPEPADGADLAAR